MDYAGLFLNPRVCLKVDAVCRRTLIMSTLGSAKKVYFPRHKNPSLDIPVHINHGLWIGVSEPIEVMEYAQIWSYSFVLYPAEKKWPVDQLWLCLVPILLTPSTSLRLFCPLPAANCFLVFHFLLLKESSQDGFGGSAREFPATVF